MDTLKLYQLLNKLSMKNEHRVILGFAVKPVIKISFFSVILQPRLFNKLQIVILTSKLIPSFLSAALFRFNLKIYSLLNLFSWKKSKAAIVEIT